MSSTRTKRPVPSSRPRPASVPARRPPWLWIALGALVAFAAVVAVAGSRETDRPDATAGIEETRDVELTGAALPRLGDGVDPAIGQIAPIVQGATFDGTPVTIGGSGRATVVAFVAHWCPHCQREVPLLSDHLTDAPMPADVDLITVSTSTSPDRPNYPPSAWLDRERWPGPTLADDGDGAAARAFGLSGFPFFVAIDADGEVVARTSGEISTEQFDQLVALAAGTDSP